MLAQIESLFIATLAQHEPGDADYWRRMYLGLEITCEATDEARRAALEGTVILDVVVGEDGWVRDVTIVQGLAQGLGEAAVRAIKSCRFTPGERDGKPVAVRVPRFKVVFSLGEAK